MQPLTRTALAAAAAALLGTTPLAGQGMQPMNLPGTAVPQTIQLTGGGPVLQILPGPAPYAQQAMRFVRSMPGEMPQAKKQQMQKIARMGPFSNRVARISGDFQATLTDSGETGDRAAGTAEFTTQDGAKWRVVLTGVDPTGDPPMEPHWGGVGTNRLLHGTSGHHNPFVPKVNSIAMWGMADVWRNGEQVQTAAPVHVMLTSHTRNPRNFNYQCYDCTGRPMDELHLIMMPKGDTDKYQAPGGFLHIMWEQSSAQMMAPR